MGCFWSRQRPNERCRCWRCGHRGVTDINHLCEDCVARARVIRAETILSSVTRSVNVITPRRPVVQAPTQGSVPCYGEYRCSCGRTWKSRRTWPGNYQICEGCRTRVYAHTQRALRPSDKLDAKENHEKHKIELCQKCQQLGYDCGSFQTRNNRARAKSLDRSRSKSAQGNNKLRNACKDNRKW